MKRTVLTCMCIGVLFPLMIACGGGGGGQDNKGKQTFNLVFCDQNDECSKVGDGDFECSPVYCQDKCIPDASGKCMPCNQGKKGKCLPKPKPDCGKCDADSECVKACTGYCDPVNGKCKDVACEAKCMPKPAGCTADADCGKGKHCEFSCTKCAPEVKMAGDAAMPKCIGGDCKGVCVDNPPPPKQCNKDADCGAGFICGPVACPAICAPDGKGGCLPCNDGFLGICMPEPQSGCKADTDCKPGELCQLACMGACDAFAPECKSECKGMCVPKPNGCAGVDCGPGFKCEEICLMSDCAQAGAPKGASFRAEPTDKAPPPDCGGCFPNCIPIQEPGKCDSDKDCKPGYHCEPVACPMICKSDGKGGCLPCNDGKLGVCVADPTQGCKTDADCKADEQCQTMCADMCGPDGCEETCKGVCVPKAQGCKSDADCGPGFHCEMMCPGTCAQPAYSDKGSDAPMPGCFDAECFGQCVKDPIEPKKCNTDKDCPDWMKCEVIYCAQAEFCVPDRKGGCLPTPCNDGFAGVCVPKPQTGCKTDADCKPGEMCQGLCMGACGPQGCFEECKGECVPAQVDCGQGAPCPAGFVCEVMCVDCAPGTDCQGGCFGKCVPEKPQPDKCNADAECPKGWHCEPIFCTMQCIPDEKGGCLPCNDGFLGICSPDAQEGCKTDADCAPGEACQVYCMGFCDAAGFCGDECKGVCVPKAQGCQSDAECPKGTHCEWMCTKGCATPAGSSGADPAMMPKCPDSECFGQCVPNPVEPGKCNGDKDCPEGFQCEPVACDMKCAPDGKGGCLPCNGGFFGVCVPKPQNGCTTDQDCAPGESCHVYCMGACAPDMGCSEVCQGVCFPKQAGCGPDQPCPEGQECQMMCYDCASDSTDCAPGCFGICMDKPVDPKKCNADGDCPKGFHCEVVYCTMVCIDDGKGGCLPCNGGFAGQCLPDPTTGCQADTDCAPGEECKTYCMGFCDPNSGCSETCMGECVPMEKGCKVDADCGEGFVCEKMCPPSCGATEAPKPGDPTEPAPPCVDQECFGQCVAAQVKCTSDKDCPAGFICAPTMNPTGISVCIPAETKGCTKDSECKSGEYCAVECPMFCSGSGCDQYCQGQCLPIPPPVPA